MKSARFGLAALVLAGMLAGCSPGSASPTPGATPTATPTPAPTPTETPTPALTATPTPALTATPTPAPTPAPTAPPIPTSVKLTDGSLACPADWDPCFSYKVTWTQADPTDVTIKIYAVKDCLNPSVDPELPRTCVIPGLVLPNASLVLLGSVPAATGTFSFNLRDGVTYGYGWFPNGDYAYAIVVAAVNAYGSSLWVIAGSSDKCDHCTI